MMEIKEHVRLAKEDPTRENIAAMWRAVFRLPAWYLLPAQQEAGPATPLVAQIDEGHWLVAFTHFRRLNEFARSRGLRDARGEINMLALTPDEAVQRVEELAEHLTGILFNPGSEESFRAPTESFRQIYRTI